MKFPIIVIIILCGISLYFFDKWEVFKAIYIQIFMVATWLEYHANRIIESINKI